MGPTPSSAAAHEVEEAKNLETRLDPVRRLDPLEKVGEIQAEIIDRKNLRIGN